MVRWLGVAEDGRDEHVAEHEAEIAARREALDAALAIARRHHRRPRPLRRGREAAARTAGGPHQPVAASLDPDQYDVSALGTELTRELIATEREFIHEMLRDGKITDETRRRIERDLDLEEASLANREFRRTPL